MCIPNIFNEIAKYPIRPAVARAENGNIDLRWGSQHKIQQRSEVPTGGTGEVTCFQYVEAIQATDAIRLTTLLQKATLDPSGRPCETPIDQRHVQK
ncbi:MAG: hypothetical protein WB781_10950 [Candidatus Sulfotelmatobacter sp.]